MSGSVWRRAVLIGVLAMMVAGMAGVHSLTLLGAAVMVGAVLVQCWQSADERCKVEKASRN